jgi:hypothetical protein
MNVWAYMGRGNPQALTTGKLTRKLVGKD